jgi:CHAT domain-containing protein/tetratricopeptide (TPR) repeat protein
VDINESTSFVRKLLKGEYGLARTFWIGLAVNLAVRLLGFYLQEFVSDSPSLAIRAIQRLLAEYVPASTPIGEMFDLVVVIPAYLFFTAVWLFSIWRCIQKNNSQQRGSTLFRIVVVFIAVSFAGVTGYSFWWNWQVTNLDINQTYRQYEELLDAGKFAEAVPVVEKHIMLTRDKYGVDGEEYPGGLYMLAGLLVQLGKYDDAEKFYQEALQRLELLRPHHPGVALISNDVGALYKDTGRFEQAEFFYRKAINIEEEISGKEYRGLRMKLNNLAGVLALQERFEEAEELLLRAISISGPDRNDLASVYLLNGLGTLYFDQGLYKKAIPLLVRSYELTNSVEGIDPEVKATMLNNLGQLYLAAFEPSKAREYLLEAIDLVANKLGPEHPSLIVKLNNLSAAYAGEEDYKNAEVIGKRALAIAENSFGPDHYHIASLLNTLSYLYSKNGDHEKAEQLMFRGINILKAALPPDHADLILSYRNTAHFFAAQGIYTEALDWHRLATSIVRKKFSDADVEKSREVSREVIFHVDLALHPEQEGGRDQLEAEAFEAVQLARFSSTGRALSKFSARFATKDTDLAKLIRERQDVLQVHEKLERHFVEILALPGSKQNSKTEQRIRGEIEVSNMRLAQLQGSIQQNFPQFDELTRLRPLRIADVKTLLKTGEALITFMSSSDERQFHVFVVRKDQAMAYTVELSRDETVELVTRLRAGLDTSRIKSINHLPYYDLATAHQLYKRLLSPAEPMLEDIQHLFVVPSSALESIPLGILVTEKPEILTGSLEEYRNAAWLYRKIAITTLPSIRSLKALRKFARPSQAVEPFLGFGDPILEGTGSLAPASKIREFFTKGIADVNKVRMLEPLPETADELQMMASYLDADAELVYLREHATERQVKTMALDAYRVIAFSTHALISGQLGLHEPALVLTPPAKGSIEDDGLLTASEIAQLKLDADWVVLSACNTASGTEPGAEGLSGLARAFFYSGARTLLVSHWPVVAEVSARITTTIFRERKLNPQTGPAEALRLAMLSVMKSKSEPAYAHPIFWAPFVVVGEGAVRD